MTKIFTVLSFLVLLTFSSFGQIDRKYSKTLKKMFEVSGTEESYQMAIKQMVTMFKQEHTEVNSDIWDELEEEFLKTSINDLTEMLVPVYSKYLTKEDLEELIEFYQSPVGKKFSENTPLIMQESMVIGQEWGRKMGEDFVEKMKKKGY